MIKEERINHKVAIKRVENNILKLKNSPQTLRSIYDIIFSHPSYTFINQMTSYGYDEVTYGKADIKCRLFAYLFKENIDINEKYIGLLLENSKEWIYSFFGLLISGFIPVLFSTSFKKEELDYVINKLNIKTIITNKEIDGLKTINPFEPIFRENKAQIESLDNFSNEIAFLSSGSTGLPKIVFYNGEEICSQLYDARDVLYNTKGIDASYKGYFKHLVVLPFFHVFGLICVLLWFSFFNVCFVLPLNLNPKSIRQACLLANPTHIFAVPLFYETIVKSIYLKLDTDKKKKKFEKALSLSYKLQKTFGLFGTGFVRDHLFKKYLSLILGTSIRFMITGGSFIKEDTLRVINLLGYPLVNGYGSTEVGIVSLSSSSSISDRMSSSIGKPFDSISFKIENNHLLVSSKSSSSHIITPQDELFISKPTYIDTLDNASIVNDKYYLLGRSDEIVIKENGENISLPQIEKELLIPSSKEFVLVKMPNDEIYLVASFDKLLDPALCAKELKEALNNSYSKYITKVLYTTIDLPKANEIKYKRHELSKLIEGSPNDFIPLSELNEKSSVIKENVSNGILNGVIDVFTKFFNDKEVNENSHFYNDLGGDSLHYFMLLNEIEEKFNIEIMLDSSNPPYTPNEFLFQIEASK